jgi:hypothetical protein
MIKFIDLYNNVKSGHEFECVDNDVDCTFYIYKENDLNTEENPLVVYIVETQEVEMNKNGSYIINLFEMLKPKQKELFNEFAYKEFYENENDDDFIFDLIQDLEQFINMGHMNTCIKITNILRGEEL